MTTLTNITGVQSPSGDLLTISPLEYNGSPIAGGVPPVGGDGIDVTGSTVSVDLYSSSTAPPILNIIGLDPVHDGGYEFVRNGHIIGGIFYDQPSTYALFAKPDGSEWDVVYFDGSSNWYSITTSSDPTTLSDGSPISFTSPGVLVAVSSTAYMSYMGPDDADPNVSYSGGSGSPVGSYLEFVGGKLRVDTDALTTLLTAPEGVMQTFYAPFTYSDSVIQVPGLEEYMVTDIRMLVTTPFNAPNTIMGGTLGDMDMLFGSSTFNLTSSSAQVHMGLAAVGLDPIRITHSGSATAGEAALVFSAFKP